MLTHVATAVKCSPLPDPEQIAIDHALELSWIMVERLKAAAQQQEPIHYVEETVFRQLLVICSRRFWRRPAPVSSDPL